MRPANLQQPVRSMPCNSAPCLDKVSRSATLSIPQMQNLFNYFGIRVAAFCGAPCSAMLCEPVLAVYGTVYSMYTVHTASSPPCTPMIIPYSIQAHVCSRVGLAADLCACVCVWVHLHAYVPMTCSAAFAYVRLCSESGRSITDVQARASRALTYIACKTLPHRALRGRCGKLTTCTPPQ